MKMHTETLAPDGERGAEASVPFASPSFRILLALTMLVLGLCIGGIHAPAAWLLGILCAVTAYRFSEALLILFVVLLPPGLLALGVGAYFLH